MNKLISLILAIAIIGFLTPLEQSQAQTKSLSIDVKAKDENFGGEFQDSLEVGPDILLRFQIKITATGNSPVQDVIIRNVLPTKLVYLSGSLTASVLMDTRANLLFGGGLGVEIVNLGQPITLTFFARTGQAHEFNVGRVTLTNTAFAKGGGASEVSDSASITISKMGSTSPMPSPNQKKTAFNLTQNLDATTIPANPGDIIVYTLTYKNTGSAAINVIIEDDIADVLELAQMINTGGAVVDNNILKFPAASVSPGTEVSRSFQVKVREISFVPAGSDFLMANTYGNQTRVVVRQPQVAGIFTKPLSPPRTGAGENLVIALAGLFTAGYWLYRKNKLNLKLWSLILLLLAGVLLPVLALGQTRTLSVEHLVRNLTRGESSFQTSTTAQPGDRLQFQTTLNTSGSTAPQHNVILRELLPQRLLLASGEASLLAASGLNLGTLAAGTSQTLSLEVIVTGLDSETLTATALARSDEVSERSGLVVISVTAGTGTSRDLVIENRVRNLTAGETTWQKATTASQGERLRFEIRVEAVGNAPQSNVFLRFHLPARLTFVSGDMNLIVNGISVGNLPAGAVRSLVFEAVVNGSGPVTVLASARVRSDEVSEREAQASVFVTAQPRPSPIFPNVAGTSVQLRKEAFNKTRGVEAASRPAFPGDLIVYTLHYRNTGKLTMENLRIEDNLKDVLELARLTKMGEAVALDNGILKFPPISLAAGTEVTRSFEVTVLPVELIPVNSDLVIANVYGNEVRIQVQKVPAQTPQVAGAVIPPRTGAGMSLVIVLAGFFTVGYWLYRNSKFKMSCLRQISRLP